MTTDNILGVDIGGVIISSARDGQDTSFFSENFLATPPIKGAFDAIAKLSEERYGTNIHLVSKCGKKTEDKTRKWLAHHRFFELTGVPFDHMHFCLERADKAPICESLGVTCFIDDRLDVLRHLKSVDLRILFATKINQTAVAGLPIAKVADWNGVNAVLLP